MNIHGPQPNQGPPSGQMPPQPNMQPDQRDQHGPNQMGGFPGSSHQGPPGMPGPWVPPGGVAPGGMVPMQEKKMTERKPSVRTVTSCPFVYSALDVLICLHHAELSSVILFCKCNVSKKENYMYNYYCGATLPAQLLLWGYITCTTAIVGPQ